MHLFLREFNHSTLKQTLMKNAAFPIVLMLFACSTAFGQSSPNNRDGSGTVLLDNDKLEVIQFVGKAGKDVCGIGEHHHRAHLTVALTDAQLSFSDESGDLQQAEIPAGAALWFEPGTHSVLNSGAGETNFLLIYLKD